VIDTRFTEDMAAFLQLFRISTIIQTDRTSIELIVVRLNGRDFRWQDLFNIIIVVIKDNLFSFLLMNAS
jgi:hypothetical protein